MGGLRLFSSLVVLVLLAASCSSVGHEPISEAELAEAVRAGFPERSPLLDYGDLDLEAFSRCLAAGLLVEVGSERLRELRIIELGVFSDAVVRKVAIDVEGASVFFTPFFDCFDWEPMIVDDLTSSGWPDQSAECVAERAVQDPEARLAFIIGTRDPSGSSASLPDEWRLVQERVIEIQAECGG